MEISERMKQKRKKYRNRGRDQLMRSDILNLPNNCMKGMVNIYKYNLCMCAYLTRAQGTM